VQEAAKKVARMPTSGLTHEQVAGDGDDRHAIDINVRARAPTRKV